MAGAVVVVYLSRPPILSPFPPSLSPARDRGREKKKPGRVSRRGGAGGGGLFFLGGLVRPPLAGWFFVRVCVRGRVRV